MAMNCGQITGIVLTILSTILALVPIGIAGAGAGSDYDVYCYDKSQLEIAVAAGVIGIICHIVASVLYLRFSGSVTTANPVIVGTVATSSPTTTSQ